MLTADGTLVLGPAGSEKGQAKGPWAYENWRKLAGGAPCSRSVSVPLFSDGAVTGTAACGPYRMQALEAKHEQGVARPVIALDIASHGDGTGYYRIPPLPWQTDESAYYGGGAADEIAALWSLLLGVRLQAGRPTKQAFDNDIPGGRPWLVEPQFPPTSYATVDSVCPGPEESRLLDRCTELFSTYPSLTPTQAIALVRAARSYQTGIWIADVEPNTAWLLLVSAVEVAAVEHQGGSDDPVTVLRRLEPAWATRLEAAGGEILDYMARKLARLLHSKARFLEFVDCFAPPPPHPRTSIEDLRLDWTTEGLRRALGLIYKYRSRALHGGLPFPMPMLQAHLRTRGEGFIEIPSGLGESASGAVWVKDDYAMMLQTFEYISRRALLKWWGSLVGIEKPMFAA